MLNKAGIAALIPHAGGMCLLDEVLNWNENEASCLTRTHIDPENPLRRNGALSGLHLIEYGAQASAVHGGLVGRQRGMPLQPGLLAAVRKLWLDVERLDDLPPVLLLQVRRMAANPQGRIYSFEARSGERTIGGGSLVIMVER